MYLSAILRYNLIILIYPLLLLLSPLALGVLPDEPHKHLPVLVLPLELAVAVVDAEVVVVPRAQDSDAVLVNHTPVAVVCEGLLEAAPGVGRVQAGVLDEARELREVGVGSVAEPEEEGGVEGADGVEDGGGHVENVETGAEGEAEEAGVIAGEV